MNRKAPIFSLPNEVLSSILEQGAIPQPTWLIVREEAQRYEIVISHVTQRLRSVAIGTPSLWRRIFVSDSTPCDLIQLYLVRSKGISLEIYIYFVGRLNPPRVSLQAILGLFIPHITRWLTLRVRVHDEQLSHSLAHLLESQAAPILEFVEVDAAIDDDDLSRDYIHKDDWCGQCQERSACTMFSGGAPSLKTIRLRGTHHSVFAPVGAAQTLHLDFLTYLRPMQTWITGSSLSCLFLHGSCPVATLELPSLTSLYMLNKLLSDDSELDEPCEPDFRLINYLEAPLLQRLTMEGADTSLEQIVISGKPRFPNLEFLALCPTALSGEYDGIPWMHVSKCFPSVKHVASFDLSLYDILECLVHGNSDEGDPPAWPEMETLALADVENDYAIDQLLDFVSDRQMRGMPLCKILLHEDNFAGFEESESSQSIRDMIEVRSFQSKLYPLRNLEEWYEGG